jgi:2'-5' RNA ligase
LSDSAFVVRVPEAEGRVGDLRQRFDASAGLGVPAHVTVLFPFMPPEQINADVVRRAQAALAPLAPFALRLLRVGRFAATAWLAPEPAQPFIALTEALVGAFPGFLPFRGEHASVVPRLSVAHGSGEEAEIAAAELARRMHAHGPVESFCGSVALLDNASGPWRDRQVFALVALR